jgi:hypothetical protein
MEPDEEATSLRGTLAEDLPQGRLGGFCVSVSHCEVHDAIHPALRGTAGCESMRTPTVNAACSRFLRAILRRLEVQNAH